MTDFGQKAQANKQPVIKMSNPGKYWNDADTDNLSILIYLRSFVKTGLNKLILIRLETSSLTESSVISLLFFFIFIERASSVL